MNAYSARNLGRLLENQDRCAEAVAFLEKAVSLKPSDGWSKLRWARCHREPWAVSEAILLLEELVAEADDPQLLDSAGLSALLLDEPETAEALYLKALDLGPSRADSLRNLATAQERAGRTEEAIETLQGCREELARHGSLVRPGIFLVRLRRDQEALDALRNVIELAPDDARALG